MDNNIFKATMRKITGDEQPANTMNKRAQTQPPPQQSAQPSTYNPLVERLVTVLLGGPVLQMLPTSLVLASNGNKPPLGYWVRSQVRGLCCLWSTPALCSSVLSRQTIFMVRAGRASLVWWAPGAGQSQWPPCPRGDLWHAGWHHLISGWWKYFKDEHYN